MQAEIAKESRIAWEERCAHWSAQIRVRFKNRCAEAPGFLGQASRTLGIQPKVLEAGVNSGAAYRLPMDAVGRLMLMLGMSAPKE